MGSGKASRAPAAKHGRPESQAAGDERRGAGDGPGLSGTSGGARGISGVARGTLVYVWLIYTSIALLVMAINIVTRGHNLPEQGWLWPAVDEATSALVTAVTAWAPLALAYWTVAHRPPRWLAASAWSAGAALYPVLHIGGFVMLRTLVYGPLLGRGYDFGPVPSEFLYEASKDVPTFAFGGFMAWLVLRWRLGEGPPAVSGDDDGVLDIRDGARLIRAPVAEVLAARSAGNYVVFLLADGRRPLMRTSLGALAEQLAGRGFVRTHRSWLVNTARVTGLRPDGSGDYTVELGGEEAPLSRRFPAALKAIRA